MGVQVHWVSPFDVDALSQRAMERQGV